MELVKSHFKRISVLVHVMLGEDVSLLNDHLMQLIENIHWLAQDSLSVTPPKHVSKTGFPISEHETFSDVVYRWFMPVLVVTIKLLEGFNPCSEGHSLTLHSYANLFDYSKIENVSEPTFLVLRVHSGHLQRLVGVLRLLHYDVYNSVYITIVTRKVKVLGICKVLLLNCLKSCSRKISSEGF